MKKITWNRPHLTSFGLHQIMPGENLVEDSVATEIGKHWAYDRAAKAGLVKIEDATAVKTAPAAEKKTVKKGADSDA
jgi:hypothetical protein